MQHVRPSGFSQEFQEMVKYFAEKYLIKETIENLFATVCFFEHHPKINRGLLDAAITETILSRADFTDDIWSPQVIILLYLFLDAKHLYKSPCQSFS